MLAILVAWGCATGAAVELKDRLDKIVGRGPLPRAQLGLAVFEIGRAPQTLAYALNEQRDFIPASVTKLATAATVLAKLGPSFKFQTTLWSAGRQEGETLTGDLVLKGGGDPGFVSETMWFLVNDFVRAGITKVVGNLVVDDTDFDDVRTDPSREPERVDRAYDAPVGAMSFNWNSLNIYVRPTAVGEAPRVRLDPLEKGFVIDNKAKTVNTTGHQLEVSRVGSRVVVRGTIGISTAEVAVYKNIDDPARWAGQNLVEFLAQRGITVTGKVVTGSRPAAARQLAKAESKPVSQAVTDMMKFSNNYVAEMLTKDLAAQTGTAPATLEAGMKLVREQVTEFGIAASRFTLLNPSGLNRRNQLKPIDLALLLLAAAREFAWYPEFLSALPLAGQDGTLKRRMKNGPAEGWVRAKTGNLNGVAALAGYAGRRDGSTRAFAFIFNGKPDQGDVARRLFDQLATELVQ